MNSDEVDKGALTKGRLHSTARKALRGPKRRSDVPLVAESLGGLGRAAIKLFAEIARLVLTEIY